MEKIGIKLWSNHNHYIMSHFFLKIKATFPKEKWNQSNEIGQDNNPHRFQLKGKILNFSTFTNKQFGSLPWIFGITHLWNLSWCWMLACPDTGDILEQITYFSTVIGFSCLKFSSSSFKYSKFKINCKIMPYYFHEDFCRWKLRI